MTLFEQAYKKSHIKEDKDGWRGVPGVTMIYHGDWSDPELEYDGQTRNYWDVEDSMYDFYKELKNAGDEDHLAQPQKYKFDDSDEDFNKFCQDHADDVYDCFRESRKVNASKHIKESETTDYEEAGWELVNNAIDSFEYSDRQVDRIHIKAKDTGDTVIVHVTGMPKVAKKRLSDFIDDNLTKAGFEGTSRVGVFGDEVTVELWK